MRREEHFSAGGVVYRNESGVASVVLCGRIAPKTWSLPKGTPDPGEATEETALREVREETGLDVVIESDLGEIEYWFAIPEARVHKRVRFYLMSPVGGSIDDHDPEFDLVQWFTEEDAVKALTYPNEARMLSKALDYVHQRRDTVRGPE